MDNIKKMKHSCGYHKSNCADCLVMNRVIGFLIKEAKTNIRLLKALMKLGRERKS